MLRTVLLKFLKSKIFHLANGQLDKKNLSKSLVVQKIVFKHKYLKKLNIYSTMIRSDKIILIIGIIRLIYIYISQDHIAFPLPIFMILNS